MGGHAAAAGGGERALGEKLVRRGRTRRMGGWPVVEWEQAARAEGAARAARDGGVKQGAATRRALRI